MSSCAILQRSCDLCTPFLAKLILEMSERFEVESNFRGEYVCCFQLDHLDQGRGGEGGEGGEGDERRGVRKGEGRRH